MRGNDSDAQQPQQQGGDGDDEVVEKDPQGRYHRYRELVGKGRFKVCHKAFDASQGIDVAWSKFSASSIHLSDAEIEAVVHDIQTNLDLDHPNIIKSFKCWEDAQSACINLITELFTSGNLRQYRNQYKHLDLKAVKRMARQILRGLHYLHSMEPPITHGDLRCDKIYVNGNSGEIKIGDIGLATLMPYRWEQAGAGAGAGTPGGASGGMPPSAAASGQAGPGPASEQSPGAAVPVAAAGPAATPEQGFPQPLDCHACSTATDIFAFGLCMLELLTLKQLDLQHCADWAESVAEVADEDARAFITKCLSAPRPTAEDLLEDPFLALVRQGDPNASLVRPQDPGMASLNASSKSLHDVLMATSADHKRKSEEAGGSGAAGPGSEEPGSPIAVGKLRGEDYIFAFAGKVKAGKMHFRLVMTQAVQEANDTAPPFMRTIDFVFDPEVDTADKLAAEISETFNLSPTDTEICAAALRERLAKEMPGLDSGSSK